MLESNFVLIKTIIFTQNRGKVFLLFFLIPDFFIFSRYNFLHNHELQPDLLFWIKFKKLMCSVLEPIWFTPFHSVFIIHFLFYVGPTISNIVWFRFFNSVFIIHHPKSENELRKWEQHFWVFISSRTKLNWKWVVKMKSVGPTCKNFFHRQILHLKSNGSFTPYIEKLLSLLGELLNWSSKPIK